MNPHPGPRVARLVAAVALASLVALPGDVSAQAPRPHLPHVPHVLLRTGDEGPHGPLALDEGATGLWQKLLKLRTTASVLYTTGHPDDEESGVLTLLSRGMGVRTALLTLNRGEGGANALGSELFDALGLVRTEELRLAGRYYGLDDQYFTTAVDYGFSKTLDEAMRSWDREALLGDMVRVIRMNRPLVVVSRWYGGARDGHGHHQAAGVLTPLAVAAAADPTRFPDQISHEQLRPWAVKKLFRGRLLDGEPWSVALDPGRTDPWLGRSYGEVGAEGLSLQRSQTAGRMRSFGRGAPSRYERLVPAGPGMPDEELFEGLDTTLPGLFDVLGETPPAGALEGLRAAGSEIDAALDAFRIDDTRAVTDHLVTALHELRAARRATPDRFEAAFHLAVKERQLTDALGAALGVRLDAVATPPGTDPDTPMGPLVPGGSVEVHVRHDDGGAGGLRVTEVALRAPAGWRVEGGAGVRRAGDAIDAGNTASTRFVVHLPADAEPSRPWFFRESIAENAYQVRDSSALGLAEAPPLLVAAVTLDAGGEPLTLTTGVRTLEADAPYGTLRRRLAVVPRLSLRTRPTVHVLAAAHPDGFDMAVDVISADADAVDAEVTLELPDGWSATPRSVPVRFEGAGQHATAIFAVTPAAEGGGGGAAGAPPAGGWTLVAVARTERAGRIETYREGYETIRHRDLGLRRLYRPARTSVVPVDVAVAPDLSVGYVMGVGDAVPEAIEELGARVTLLDASALASGDLSAYDVIVVGTRAYAVRPDLVAATPRLLGRVRDGGHMVVLYQTPEFDPGREAPLPATLPGDAEETSEEDAPVTLLAPGHPLLASPNRIGPADFDGWIEQRGSKFFADWDAGYTPLVETHDTGQAPQRGVWLAAKVGRGTWTYVALALHRQLPYGVGGAYRILANLVSQAR